jgi:hypothetical protein
MPQTDVLITCANCGRPVREADASNAGWRLCRNGGELVPVCSLCAYREFHPDAPAARDD